MDLTGGLNWYDLYRPLLPAAPPKEGMTAAESRMGSVMINGTKKTYKKGYTFGEYTPWLKKYQKDDNPFIFAEFLTEYINEPEVRKALHIPDDIQAYEQCNDNINGNYSFSQEGSMWIY